MLPTAFTLAKIRVMRTDTQETVMPQYEYKVVPAPKKGVKSWGMKSSEDRFATALTKLMNDFGADGWEYQRSDTLPCEEKSGFRGRTTVFQNMLVFRRLREEAAMDAPVEPKRTRLIATAPEPKTEPKARVEPPAEPRLARSEPAAEAPVAEAGPKLPVFMRPNRDDKSDVAAE